MALIGVGRIGALHARTLRANRRVSELTLVDTDRQRAATLAHELGVAHAASAEAVMGSVDALVIAAATPAHAELIHLAADARVAAFCEKPIALEIDVTDAVIAHVERSGILVQIGFQRRFDAGYVAAREARAVGALGDVQMVRLATHDPAPPRREYIAASGGIWRDLAIHDFDIAPWVLGSPIVEVFAYGEAHGDDFARYDDVDAACAVLRFEGGALGVVTAARNDPRGYDVRMELFGLRDSVAVGWDERTPLRSLEPGASTARSGHSDFIERFTPAYRAELDTFLDTVATGGPSQCTMSDARRALVVALAANRSLRDRRPVTIDELNT